MKRAQPRNPARLLPVVAAVAALAALAAAPAHASSHREAPSITTTPKVDGTDFYMFNSYEPARLTGPGYVTLVANYLPLQDAYGGPNYFKLDPNALYEIHVDNNGDGKEDITFQFRFNNTLRGTTLKIGGTDVAIPLTQSGQITAPNATTSNVNETFTVDIVRGDRRTGTRGSITNATGGSATFAKPVDNIGMKTIPNYAAYAAQHIYAVNIPGCTAPGKVFVGQRKDPFAVNLGVVFDLLNVPGAADFTPAEAAFLLDNSKKDAGEDDLADANVTTLALEVPTSCLLASGANDPVIGGWTTASLRQGSLLSSAPKSGHQTSALTGGAWTQVSRLGMPLVNELVIGLPDKDKFNNSKPKDDGQFAAYVTNPTLPALVEIALATPGIAPTNFPRTDLVTTFLTGIAGVNQLSTVTGSELLRLNTAIPAKPYAMQNRLGLLGGLLAGGSNPDLAGYPNGRRPNDDVTDIAIRVVGGQNYIAAKAGDGVNFLAGAPGAGGPNVTATGIARNFPFLPDPYDSRNRRHVACDDVGPGANPCGPLVP